MDDRTNQTRAQEPHGTQTVSFPTTARPPTLAEQLERLRDQALAAVAEASNEVDHRDADLDSARHDLRLAVAIAVNAGVEREQVAKMANVSISTVSKWHADAMKVVSLDG